MLLINYNPCYDSHPECGTLQPFYLEPYGKHNRKLFYIFDQLVVSGGL